MTLTAAQPANDRRVGVRPNAQGLAKHVQRVPGFERFIGASESILQVVDRTQRAAETESTVIIRGESGTGKELIADAIHQNSARNGKPFVVVNIAALPETLLESELFGHVKGAFTSASTHRIGLFEAASEGTLFIDEIGDLALNCQAKLLRVLENHRVTPVGGGKERRVDVRVVAATHHDLERLVREGKFREDLYYRLHVVTIHIPPLRERPGDIAPLVHHFLHELCRRNGKPALKVDPELMESLQAFDWPGNVRQLRNCIESMIVLARSETLSMDDLPTTVRDGGLLRRPELTLPANKSLAAMEELVVRERLKRHDGNRSHTARSLGISLRTLQRKLKKWGPYRRRPSHANCRKNVGTE